MNTTQQRRLQQSSRRLEQEVLCQPRRQLQALGQLKRQPVGGLQPARGPQAHALGRPRRAFCQPQPQAPCRPRRQAIIVRQPRPLRQPHHQALRQPRRRATRPRPRSLIIRIPRSLGIRIHPRRLLSLLRPQRTRRIRT